MRKIGLVLLIVFSTVMMKEEAIAQPRIKENFNKGWKFRLDSTGTYRDSATNDTGWRRLNLPHDWSIEGDFSATHPATFSGGALPGGIGWYRKTFTVPDSEYRRKISIHFDGVYRNSEVWINGHYLGKRPNGYISFEYDLTPYLNYGKAENLIAVKVDNSQQPNSRWYSGSGIYRNVWLIKTNSIFIPAWGSYIATPEASQKQARIRFETTIKNESGKAETIQVITAVYNQSGAIVASQSREYALPEGSSKMFANELLLAQPELWSVAKPYLYKAVTHIKLNGLPVDRMEQPLGIRYFSMDKDEGFFLNGKPLKILGVCNHHDLGCIGATINTSALKRQLLLLKNMGCNGIRTAHNPPAPELLDLCDKMGFIVMDEAFDMWKKEKNPYDYHLDWEEWFERDLTDQVLRDRNHPSVFFWSVGNEIMEQWGDEKKGDTTGRVIARELVKIVQRLDTSRPIVTANNDITEWNNLVRSNAFDVIGINYHHQQWPDFHKMYPDKKLIVTESVSALETRGHYDLVPMDTIRRWPEAWDKPLLTGNKDFTVSAYDHVSTPWGSTHEETWRTFINHDFISGMFIWTGFDYLGEPTPYTWPARSSYFGIIDLAGFPKDVYYMYQSEATSKPVLHVLPHWNWQKGDKVEVVAYYNNADEVELYLNGKSLGKKKKKKDQYHVSWPVIYKPGKLRAVSRKGGKTVLVREVKTAKEPAKMVLSADRRTIKADGNDMSFITVKVVDKNGVMVPNANNNIKFVVKGAGMLKATDNGDPTSHASFLSSERPAFNGLCLGVLQSSGKKGNIILTVVAEGLPPASIIVEAK